MFTVYILKSLSKNRFYVGHTSNLDRRFREHNSGHTKSTKYGIPWKIIWKEEFSTRVLAMNKEIQIKKRGIERFLTDI